MLARALPVVEINGKRYYADNRLRQFRNVENPHDFMDWDMLQNWYLDKLFTEENAAACEFCGRADPAADHQYCGPREVSC